MVRLRRLMYHAFRPIAAILELHGGMSHGLYGGGMRVDGRRRAYEPEGEDDVRHMHRLFDFDPVEAPRHSPQALLEVQRWFAARERPWSITAHPTLSTPAFDRIVRSMLMLNARTDGTGGWVARLPPEMLIHGIFPSLAEAQGIVVRSPPPPSS